MNGPLDLAGWSWDGSAAGSLYAVPGDQRLPAAEQLAAAGWWVHVDVITGASGASVGVSAGELVEVRDRLPEALIEVHVIDLGPVPGSLGDLLAARPQRVVLAAERCPGDGARVRASGAQLWAEHRGTPLPEGLVVDGVLVMLIEPGTTQPIDLDRLGAVAAVPPGVVVGVDGGVGRRHVHALGGAGVHHLVSGRALLSQHQQHIRPQGTEESRR